MREMEYALYHEEKVFIIKKEQYRVLIERLDGTRLWIEEHNLKPISPSSSEKTEGSK